MQYTAGFDELMPEGRSFPFKYFPKRGVALGITFGEPIRNADIKHALQLAVASPPSNQALSSEHTVFDDSIEQQSGVVTEQGWMGDGPASVVRSDDLHHNAIEVERIRSTVTAVIQREVEKLGKHVSESVEKLT
ncbi:hypothetical protein EUX98_g7727 [Antrodiella citrinella]|uniref:Uncharacterized protein n=1 Tax=Antrodiella citrinella TaxID=2447956 RepID=A0A4S4ML48_9APHY|nr:hypothetical protein EUX98_g7727 [Antrodiella citrinella]